MLDNIFEPIIKPENDIIIEKQNSETWLNIININIHSLRCTTHNSQKKHQMQ